MEWKQLIATRPRKRIYREGDACIKLFDAGYSKADILNEALNQARIEETGLHIPGIREVLTIDGCWAIVSDFIEGKTLAQHIEEEPEKKAEYLSMLVDLQMEVHTKSSPLLNKLIDKMHRKICQTDLDATTRYDLHMRLEKMPKHSKLCHGDFIPSNVILTPEGIPYILDWSHATQGNGSADAARTFLRLSLEGDHEGASTYLAIFCEKTGIDETYVRRWLPIVAASQSVKGEPEEREFLLSCVNAVEDYE